MLRGMGARILLDPWFDWQRDLLWRSTVDLIQSRGFQILTPSQYSFLRERNSKRREEIDGATKIASRLEAIDGVETSTAVRGLIRRESTFGVHNDLDGEVIWIDSLVHWSSRLNSVRPDLVMFSVTPHFLESYALYIAAKSMNVPTLHFQPSAIAPRMLPRASISEEITISLNRMSNDETADESTRIFEESLSRIMSNIQPTYMARQRDLDTSSRKLRGRLSSIRWAIKWMRQRRFENRLNWEPLPRHPEALKRFLQVLNPTLSGRELRHSWSLNSGPSSRDRPFALFALHYEPERTSTPESCRYGPQIQQVLLAREHLPDSISLVVREHPSQLSPSLRGHRGRSALTYDFLSRQPGIEIVRDERLDNLVRDAHVVFTGTGNVGIEAALIGTPTVYFGYPWWSGMPGAYSFEEFRENQGGLRILKGKSHNEVRSFLKKRLMSEMLPGGASESIRALDRRFGLLSEDFSKSAAKVVARFVENYLLETIAKPGKQTR